jgi:hypothetical protein
MNENENNKNSNHEGIDAYYIEIVNKILEKGTDAIDVRYLKEQGYSIFNRSEIMYRIFKGY